VVITRFFEKETRGNLDILDVTQAVSDELRTVPMKEGLVTVFVSGSTAGITTIEYEPGLIEDIRSCFERLIPEGMRYAHEEAWHDGNGHSHVRSALLKTSLSVPFLKKKMLLGTWQQIVLVDFDNRPRRRRLVTQFVGE